MKSFNFGSKKPLISKKELEDQRKKADEQAAAVAFEEYVATFQDSGIKSANSKIWIKAGTYDAGKRQEDKKEAGKLYKPTSRFVEPKIEALPVEDSRPERLGKKKEKEKKKSNLEIFKEELKIIQEEREERHRLKTMLGLQEVIKLPPKPGDDLRASLSLELDDVRMGSIDDGDPNTTNIYLGNLPIRISEQQLMEIFGKFGPLASVKVMWPRTDEEKTRNRLSGFVAFMSRRDGERALKHLAGQDFLGADIKLGWGKAVPIPSFPIYIPPNMIELTMPPPLSGLPFNAQPDKKDRNKIPPPGTPYPTEGRGKEEFDRILQAATVKVAVPSDRSLIALIHRMVEFVIREGPMFEAMIMNREINNPLFRFLFENQSPAHIYYRWKLFSILQGDLTHRWRTEEFRMFLGGPIWHPPNLNPFTGGMPDELIPEDEREMRKGSLSNAQRDRLEKMLRSLNPERHKIAEVMIFSVEHAESAEEICLCVKESLANPKTSLTKKIARLYVVSDILHNSMAKGMNAFGYRKAFKVHLPSMFQEIHYTYQTACSEGVGESAESFKQRVCACFRAWEDWEIYPNEFLIRLQNIFLGLLTANSREEEQKIFEGLEGGENEEEALKKRKKSPPRAMMPPKSALNLVKSLQSIDNEDLDGVPLEDFEPLKIDKESIGSNEVSQPPKGAFLPSKWEMVDPEDVKAQAVTTTSKWDLFEEPVETKEEPQSPQKPSNLVEYDEDLDGIPMDEEEDENQTTYGAYEGENTESRRNKLREIEIKVMAFQDELESGRKPAKHGNIFDAVQKFREKLLRKADRESRKNDMGPGAEDNDDRSSRYSDKSSNSRSRRNQSPSDESRNHRDRGRSPHSSSSRSSRKQRSSSRSPKHRSHYNNRSRSRSRGRSKRSSSRSRSPSRRHRKHKR